MDALRRPEKTLVSVLVPFHHNLHHLQKCLAALHRSSAVLPEGTALAEVLVVADGAIDDPQPVATENGATVLEITGPQGPAVARARGAETAAGDILVFVDADVVVHKDALRRLVDLLMADENLAAVFGAYDEQPEDQGFFSQCRNLAHSFIHQRSSREASTFWAGLGAVRASVFRAVGGFDERFTRPSVEDIDLGYRIHIAGGRIRLEPSAQGTHLKRWTLWSSIVTDIRDRGVPWTQLINRYDAMRNDLNLTFKYRLAVVLSYVLALFAAGAFWQPGLLAAVPLLVGALWWIDLPYYQFFISRRGLWFTLAWFPFHIVHHLCNGVSFLLGTTLYFARRWLGIALPWALPSSPWPAREAR
jgi:GT2 family glycosyltransferase